MPKASCHVVGRHPPLSHALLSWVKSRLVLRNSSELFFTKMSEKKLFALTFNPQTYRRSDISLLDFQVYTVQNLHRALLWSREDDFLASLRANPSPVQFWADDCNPSGVRKN